MSFANNPILPGFHPDPSVCRVGADYYLVTSSFAYFPGIPIFHSRDLGHWNQIGNVLDRPSQLPLEGADVSRGIFAPTIRHHEGKFYVITTNVDHGGNFLVTATDPRGPWSDPLWLPDAPGIDPSLFFDEDGRAWYCGTRPRAEGPRYFGDWEVWVQEIDVNTGAFRGKPQAIWAGALNGAVWPEGPHLYRRGEWYYLLAAEGGTERNHAVTVARSRTILGPWVGNPANPVLTHRDRGDKSSVVNIGHADLVEAPNGQWWMVVLGSRPHEGYCNLGRETFLVPVSWEKEWPVANPGVARVEPRVLVPAMEADSSPPMDDRETFAAPVLGFDWLFLRTPDQSFWDLSSLPGWLSLACRPAVFGSRSPMSFVGKRQRHWCFRWTVCLDFHPEVPGEAAGLTVFQNEDFHFRLEKTIQGGQTVVRLVARDNAVESVLAQARAPEGKVVLAVFAHFHELTFGWLGEDGVRIVADRVDGRLVSTERAGGFVGTILALFATSTGADSPRQAGFSGWVYRGDPDA